MSEYIRFDESIGYKFGRDYRAILAAIGGRFIGCNPPAPFVFRSFNTSGILCNKFGQYLFNLGERCKDLAGKYAYAFGKLWSETSRNTTFNIVCYGPVKVYVNKKLVFASNGEIEGYTDKTTRIAIVLEKGWNSFWIQFEKTASGFGGEFGNAMPQWEPCNFHSPFEERKGQAGFIFSLPVMETPFNEETIPDLESSEVKNGLTWMPDGKWDEESRSQPAVSRVFDGNQSGKVYAWTSITVHTIKTEEVCLKGDAYSDIKIWLDGRLECCPPGKIDLKTELGFGRYDLLIESSCSGGRQWGFRLDVYRNGQKASLTLPCDIKGYDGEWLYLGVFDEAFAEKPEDIQDLYRVFSNHGEGAYWRVDQRDTVVRPFIENVLFGRWTYPLGVTLYGLLRYGEIVQSEDTLSYVRKHVGMVTKIHRYALYDKAKFGFPGVNHQIAWLDALDDCGSFGSLMLECHQKWPDENSVDIAAIIADYMMNVQGRKADGAFYRGNETMWIDDLYMSVPFLRRYYQLTQDLKYLDEACQQILLFEKYMFMKDFNTMSHIYSFVHHTANNIPWGRGNGWVIFSISELLEVLPKAHQDYEKITGLYNRLVEGYIKLQGESGLWHQVLNREDTYEESSCTAMFICAFVRGVIRGYIRRDLQDNTVSSVFKAWDGLIYGAVDSQGNVYGICRGSGYSFSPEYYKGLSWNYNDTHGIGIIMLAGTEVIRLEDYLRKK